MTHLVVVVERGTKWFKRGKPPSRSRIKGGWGFVKKSEEKKTKKKDKKKTTTGVAAQKQKKKTKQTTPLTCLLGK